MQLNRRVFLLGAAVSCMPLAGCGNINWNQIQSNWNTFIDQVVAQVAAGCSTVQGFIPTAATIAEAVAALYGAGAEQFVAGIAGAVNATATALCSALQPTPAPGISIAGARVTSTGPTPNLGPRLARSTPIVPVVIGTITINNTPIVVHGYSTRFGLRSVRPGNARTLYNRFRPQAKRFWDNNPQMHQPLENQYTR